MFTPIKTSFKFAFKNKFTSWINLVGLATGLSGFMIIMLYVDHELSYDSFHPGYQNTYRIVKDFINPDGTSIPDATTSPALTTAIRSTLPEVEAITRISPNWGRIYLLQQQDKTFYETNLIRVDNKFFDVFPYKFLSGNKSSSLEQLHSMILTQSMAIKYFGAQDPIGKMIKMNINNGTEYMVTGVIEDIPKNSHLAFDFIIPFESRRDPDVAWNWSVFYTYARLKPGTNASAFEGHVRQLVLKHIPTSLDQYHIQAIKDIHLTSHLKWELTPNGDITYINILIIIGTFIMLIACINYINLLTAQSANRIREVGVRKAVGAKRSQLIVQFLGESFIIILIAFFLSLTITTLVLPSMTPLTGIDLTPNLFDNHIIAWTFPALLIVTIIAGLYPSLNLSGYHPSKAFRSNFVSTPKGGAFRKSLVVFQFFMSSALIISALIISSQLAFMKKKDMGYTHENVLIVPNVRGGIGQQTNYSVPWDEMVRQVKGVQRVSRADGILGATNSASGIGQPSEDSHISLSFIRIDYDFIPTLEIQLAQGRNFGVEFPSDSSAIILNEEAVRQLNLKTPVIGQRIEWDFDLGKSRPVTIVGVVKDFHFADLHRAITPFGFILEVGNGSNFFIKVESKNLSATIENIEQLWNQYHPGQPFQYSFQDDYQAKLHMNDERFETIFHYFTVLAIVLACLGLFGLTIFLAEARKKEIGVRKILGASITSILQLVSREYILIVLISLSVASPIAWYGMDKWLNDYAYRVVIDWKIFAFAAVISLGLAMITISFHAIRISLSNPVASLRD